MRVLAIETATAACSVALIDEGGRVETADHAVVGRGHAERLMPMIAGLSGGGKADAIWVDCGPGSFTGTRVGIAAARALAFGWGVPAHGFSSLELVAAMWFAAHDQTAITVAMEAGHGEILLQRFAGRPLRALDSFASLSFDDAVKRAGPCIVGNAASRLAALLPGTTGTDMTPDAAGAALLTRPDLPVRPIYARAPDARVPDTGSPS